MSVRLTRFPLSAQHCYYRPHTKHYHLHRRVLRRSLPRLKHSGQCYECLTYDNASWHDTVEDHFFSPSEVFDTRPVSWDKRGRVLQFMNHVLPTGFFHFGPVQTTLSDTATRGFVATTVLLEELGIHCNRNSGSSVAEAHLQEAFTKS